MIVPKTLHLFRQTRTRSAHLEGETSGVVQSSWEDLVVVDLPVLKAVSERERTTLFSDINRVVEETGGELVRGHLAKL